MKIHASNNVVDTPEKKISQNPKSKRGESPSSRPKQPAQKKEKPDFTEGPLNPDSLEDFIKKHKILLERLAVIADELAFIWDWLHKEKVKFRAQIVSDLEIEPGAATSSVKFDTGDAIPIARQSADLLSVLAADTPTSAKSKDPLVPFKSIQLIRELMVQRGHPSMTDHHIIAGISRLKKLLKPLNLANLIESRTVDDCGHKEHRCRLKRSGWNSNAEALTAA